MKAILKKSDAKEPYTFAFVDDQGKTILRSENYAQKDSATNGIESVKKNCVDDGRYEKKQSSDGKEYFNLKAKNGQIIGTSSRYATPADRDAAIAALKQGAPTAGLEDVASK